MESEDQKKVLAAFKVPKGGIKEDPEEGSLEELDENEDEIVDTEDGGAMVKLDDDSPAETNPEHFANLAGEDSPVEDSIITKVGNDLFDLIERDIEARSRRDKAYAEGLKRTGMGEDAPGGADFEGASRVAHPMLVKASIDFSARVMKELFPPTGPAKDYIPGTPTKAKVEKARRKTAHMNRQLTVDMPEFRSELEQALTQVPLGGAAYIKMRRDEKLKRPVAEAVYIDDVIIPFSASNFLTAQRKTHRQYLTEKTYQDRIKSGVYRDINLAGVPSHPTRSEASETNDRIEGKDEDAYNQDGLRVVYETSCFLDLEEEDDFKPYLVTIDQTTRAVLSIYRNWAEDDAEFEELMHMVELPFIPWRGAYPIGLVQLIGMLAGAATGALRALLDSAHISNTPAALRLANAGGSSGGQNTMPSPGEIAEIKGSVGQDDIRKAVMPMPFKEPSAVLFQLLGFLVEAGDNVVQTTFADMSKQRNDMPVGTTLALIEQGMTVFSSIHARQHAAMAQILKILHRINASYLEETTVVADTGELMVRRQDYEGAMDVVPVSDPNIFSEAQRFAQVQVIAQRAQGNPLYDPRKVEELILERTKLPNAKDLLVPQQQPQHLNAVNENAAAVMGKPIVAFPEQDHLAHLAAHLGFMAHPMFGMSMLLGKSCMPILLTHVKEHIAFWYVTKVYDETSLAAGVPIDQLIDIKDPELTQEYDRLMAIASDKALDAAAGAFGPKLPGIIEQAVKFVQQFQQPPIMDPSAVAAQEVQRKTAADQAKSQADAQKLQNEQRQIQIDEARLQQDAQEEMARQQREDGEAVAKAALEEKRLAQEMADTQIREQADHERTVYETEAKREMNREDNDTALTIMANEIASGEKIGVSTGTGINP